MKKIVLLLLLSFAVFDCNAQSEALKSNQILSLLSQSNNVYEAIDSIIINGIDYEECYNSNSLKEKILPLLNRENFFRTQYKMDWDSIYSISAVKKYLKENSKYDIVDSVLNHFELYKSYRDSAINMAVEQLYLKYNDKPWLPNGILLLHSQIKWRESYDLLYEYWVKDDKSITSYCFKPLIMMHCPEAIGKYNKLIDKAIQLGKIDFLLKVKKDAFNINKYGSYALDLYIKLLESTTKYMQDDIQTIRIVPFNFGIVSNYYNPKEEYITSQNYKFAHLKDSLYSNNDYSDYYLEKLSLSIIRHIEDFAKQIKVFKQTLLNQELYWKQNMPYYKQEQDSLNHN